MTEPIYPDLPGLAYNVEKEPIFQTRVQRAVSGRESLARDWPYPLWQFNLTYELLRDQPETGITGIGQNEQRTLLGFWLSLGGPAGYFLFDDPDDDAVTNQALGTGDGATTTFQLVRYIPQYFGQIFSEPITAPKAISAIYFDGVAQSPTGYSVNPANGILTFTAPPALGKLITADFTYYFRCRFVEDTLTLAKFMHRLWEVKKLSLISARA